MEGLYATTDAEKIVAITSNPEAKMNLKMMSLLLLIALPVASIVGLLGDDKKPDQQRAEIGQMRDKTLTRLYKEKPDTEAEIARAFVFTQPGPF